ncbi:hypothetical protein TNCV_297561 [Trichonephila clavipes]|nr:hypothetical protein TNCV_297561 [Trichonephila clavipes]
MFNSQVRQSLPDMPRSLLVLDAVAPSNPELHLSEIIVVHFPLPLSKFSGSTNSLPRFNPKSTGALRQEASASKTNPDAYLVYHLEG